MKKVAPLVHVDKWTNLFSFMTISHQAAEPLFMERFFGAKDFFTLLQRFWCMGSQYTFKAKICGCINSICSNTKFSQQMSEVFNVHCTLLHRIQEQQAPWSVGRQWLCPNTHLDQIWLWANINRNCNTFLFMSTFSVNNFVIDVNPNFENLSDL